MYLNDTKLDCEKYICPTCLLLQIEWFCVFEGRRTNDCFTSLELNEMLFIDILRVSYVRKELRAQESSVDFVRA